MLMGSISREKFYLGVLPLILLEKIDQTSRMFSKLG
jgi:hypothetical protein